MSFKFNPDKMVDADTFTNGQRAERGEKAVRLSPDSELPTPVKLTEPADIIADILHFCDREGMDVEYVLGSAKNNWQEER